MNALTFEEGCALRLFHLCYPDDNEDIRHARDWEPNDNKLSYSTLMDSLEAKGYIERRGFKRFIIKGES